MSSQLKTIVVMLTILLIAGAILLFVSESKTHSISKLFDELADNKNHYLSCDQLPTVEQVDQTVLAHKDIVERIVGVANDEEVQITPYWDRSMAADGKMWHIAVSWGPAPECQEKGRGDMLIQYKSHDDRIKIEHIIGGETFFDIPYRLQNI
ncbi:hypothetical protein KC726_03645 [Candidatus Woesebacteria bacterium]|nr:hypothetical protein [Candidatus Woesebacteria bacterium]